MTNRSRKEIFYASAHTGVIFDYGNNTQRLLQGHCNRITTTAYCVAEDLIVTCDKCNFYKKIELIFIFKRGPDSMMVIWDGATGSPRKTIFE